jgi:hypothetical protein
VFFGGFTFWDLVKMLAWSITHPAPKPATVICPTCLGTGRVSKQSPGT